MSTSLEQLREAMRGLAESWRDDTAPEPHVSELLELADKWQPTEDPEPDVIVMFATEDDYENPMLEWFGDVVVVCPHKGCRSQEFYEEDTAVRWNPMYRGEDQPDEAWLHVADEQGRVIWVDGVARKEHRKNPLAQMPTYDISQQDGNFETTGHLCQGCQRRVSFPDWIEVSWG